VDSPGGDALASDLLWREIQQLREKKPVVASMGDTAGGCAALHGDWHEHRSSCWAWAWARV
jgi:hypothetical protein